MVRRWECRGLAWGAAGFLLALALGCGGDANRVGVSGSVRVDGQPLESGSISFLPAAGTGGPTAGAEIRQGTYSVPAESGPAPGKYDVRIKATRKTGRRIKDGFSHPPDDMVDEIEQFLPAKYNTQSELTAELKPGTNKGVDFELRLK